MASSRMRPGIPLCDSERIYTGLVESINTLESYQTPTPVPGLDDVLGTLRYLRDKIVAPQLPGRDDFAHPSAGTSTRRAKAQ